MISSKERFEEIKEKTRSIAEPMLYIDWDDIKWLIEQAERVEQLERFKVYFDELYGQGLEVAEWHMNGDLEAFDNFYESAIEHMESESSE